ncbi:MAG: hypothetical protein KAR13_19040 [Desulfobulbaceae bacterium]|nr:hypothetical protein [Desulfobulbaceae bacterium]
MGFQVNQTIKEWENILYAVKNELDNLSVATDSIGNDGSKNIYTNYLNGLVYNEKIAVHLTLTAGPKNSMYWTYFHVTANMKNGHVFYMLNNGNQGIVPVKTNKMVGVNQKLKATLKKAKEHNSSYANNDTLHNHIFKDVKAIITMLDIKVEWKDNTN